MMMLLSLAFAATVIGMGWRSYRRHGSWLRALLVAVVSALLFPLAAAFLLIVGFAAAMPGTRSPQ